MTFTMKLQSVFRRDMRVLHSPVVLESPRTGLMERGLQFLLLGQNQQAFPHQGNESRMKAKTVHKLGVLLTWYYVRQEERYY